MSELEIGQQLQIHSYKHDGKIHRAWDEAVILEVKEEYIVFGNNKTKVTEKNGSIWRTKEPAIMYFFKDKWYNIIAQLKKDGVYFYCNIASPYIIEDNTIKYIDYDLDLRVFANGEYKILDESEYAYHKKLMEYSQELETCIKNSLDELIKEYNSGNIVFNIESNKNYHKNYLKYQKQKR